MAAPFTLRIYRGGELLRAERFTRDMVKIGRISSAHLCLDDEKVARIHAVVEVAPDGRMSIVDMGSAGGTLVNGKKIAKSPLAPGDEIRLGSLRIVVEVEDGAPLAAAAAAAPVPVAPPAERETAPAVPAPGPAERESPAAPASAAEIATPQAAAPPEDAAPAASAPPAAVASAPAAREEHEPAAAPAPRGRQVPRTAAEETGGDLGVELRLLWGDALLEARTFVKPPRPATVGRNGADIVADGIDLSVNPFPILRYQDGEYRFLFGRGMAGGLERDGGVETIGELVRARSATPDGDVEGAMAVAVPFRGAVRADLGSRLAVEGRFRRPPKPAVVPWWERLDYRWLNVLLVLLFVTGAFMITAANFAHGVDTIADDLFKHPTEMAKFIIKPPEQQAQRNPALDRLAQELKGAEPGEMAAKHKGDEGQMGKRDAPKTNARSAPRAIDPNAKDIVKQTGILQVLGRGRGATGGLSTIFGTGGLGGDLKGAIGNMFGPVVGDSQGIGGLGLKGTGSGGGGQGETIGIGAVGTKGRGGGLGGYGTGVGGLGRKSDRDVAIDTPSVRILGAIDPELVRKVIREHQSQVRYCYEQQLTLNPKLEGKVAIQWQIGPDGRASNCVLQTDSSLENEEVQRCIMARIVTWEFPKPKGGGIAIVRYGWVLRASGGGG